MHPEGYTPCFGVDEDVAIRVWGLSIRGLLWLAHERVFSRCRSGEWSRSWLRCVFPLVVSSSHSKRYTCLVIQSTSIQYSIILPYLATNTHGYRSIFPEDKDIHTVPPRLTDIELSFQFRLFPHPFWITLGGVTHPDYEIMLVVLASISDMPSSSSQPATVSAE